MPLHRRFFILAQKIPASHARGGGGAAPRGAGSGPSIAGLGWRGGTVESVGDKHRGLPLTSVSEAEPERSAPEEPASLFAPLASEPEEIDEEPHKARRRG